MSMETLQAIATRRSVRKYLDKHVPWELVGRILAAGAAAPSAGNLQDWRFIIVRDDEKRKAITEACMLQSWMMQAPVHIVVIGEPAKLKRFYGTRGERLYSVQDSGAACQNMLLAAHDAGLGACWVGALDEEKLKILLKCPPETRPQAVITIGWPAEQPQKPEQFQMMNVSYIERWDGRIADVDYTLGYTSAAVRKTVKTAGNLLKRFHEWLVKKRSS